MRITLDKSCCFREGKSSKVATKLKGNQKQQELSKLIRNLSIALIKAPKKKEILLLKILRKVYSQKLPNEKYETLPVPIIYC